MSNVKCLLCGSEWGDYWEQTLGKKQKFCCEMCAVQVKNLIIRIEEDIGNKIEEIETIRGSKRKRIGKIRFVDGITLHIHFKYNSDGELNVYELMP